MFSQLLRLQPLTLNKGREMERPFINKIPFIEQCLGHERDHDAEVSPTAKFNSENLKFPFYINYRILLSPFLTIIRGLPFL
jgi:hypothetical protein